MESPVLVLMAAGMGSRYGGLKQLDPVGPHGQILMDYSLFDAARAGFERIVFIIAPSMEKDGFPGMIAQKLGRHFDVRCAVQRLDDIPAPASVPQGRTKPWGTGHAVLACRGMFDAPFAAINADDYYGHEGFATLHAFLREHPQGTPLPCAMIGYPLRNTLSKTGFVSRGICEINPGGSLLTIAERTHIISTVDGALYSEDDKTYLRLPDDAIASMNLWGFPKGFMPQLEARFARFLSETVKTNPLKSEYFLPNVVGRMLTDGDATVAVLPSDAQWHGMTYKEDLPIVRQAIARMTKEGLYPEKLWD